MDINTVIGKVITRSHTIEKLLRTHYGSKGRGLFKVIDDLADTLPAVLVRTIRLVAIVRNAAAHPEKFSLESVPPDFDRLCDEIEVLIPFFAANAPARAEPASSSNGEASGSDLDEIHKRLAKLKPGKRPAAVNSIKAMFPPTRQISDEAANQIFDELCMRGSMTIDANNRLQIRNV
jgi:hypothetical protein